MDIKILDRVTGRILTGYIQPDKLCLVPQWAVWLGLSQGGRCYPLTPERYATLLRLAKPMDKTLMVAGYVLPDTVRIVSKQLIVYHAAGADFYEVLYDIRLGVEGITVIDQFHEIRYSPNDFQCRDGVLVPICTAYGAFVKLEGTNVLKFVPVWIEAEYREYVRALMTKNKDIGPWEAVVARLYVYENTINRLLEEIAKLGDKRLAEYVASVAATYRRMLETVKEEKK